MKTIFTIGFTKKTAEDFFTKLEKAGVKRVVDIRLNNSSQLAGFAKSNDLEFFLKRISDIDYMHIVDLAPTRKILDAFKKKKINWPEYEKRFNKLMKQRKIESMMSTELRDGDCFLCSEDEPTHCHRRLAAEYLLSCWGNLEIMHL